MRWMAADFGAAPDTLTPRRHDARSAANTAVFHGHAADAIASAQQAARVLRLAICSHYRHLSPFLLHIIYRAASDAGHERRCH